MHNDTETFGTFRAGSIGPDVAELQTVLRACDAPRLAVDGRFGPATAAALAEFQSQHAVPPDAVAGPKTRAALTNELEPNADLLSLDDAQMMFPRTPRAPIARNLPTIQEALRDAGLTAPRLVLVALATIRAETEGFEPIEEGISDWNTSPGGHAFDLYDRRPGLGNHGAPDGATFRGRGYVQLTGRRNYTIFGPAAGAPRLAADPASACDPAVAARVLAAFLKARCAAILTALLADDLGRARRLVNGGEHGLLRFTDAYRRGERLLGLVR